MAKKYLTAQRLRELVEYNPEVGTFTRLLKLSHACRPDGSAGTLCKTHGYSIICVDSTTYRAARLAWLYMTGDWPVGHIDHIDGDRANDRWSNLRDVSRQWNAQNLHRARSDNQSGLMGVKTLPHRFEARIKIDGKGRYLGSFPTREEAHAAYLDAKRKLHEGCTI